MFEHEQYDYDGVGTHKLMDSAISCTPGGVVKLGKFLLQSGKRLLEGRRGGGNTIEGIVLPRTSFTWRAAGKG